MVNRIEEARRYVVEQLLEVKHTLDGEEESPRGDERTKLLFERTYLQGLVDMAVHLGDEGTSIAALARVVTRERIGYSTGQIETGILHVHLIGLDFGNRTQGAPEGQES